MISRYTNPRISRIWSRNATVYRWIDVECAAARVKDGDGADDISRILNRAREKLFERLDDAESRMHHDVAAFVHVCCEMLESAGYPKLSAQFHYMLTSSDIVDTANAIALEESCQVVRSLLMETQSALEKCWETKVGTGVARTHGRAALPIEWEDRFAYYREQLTATWTTFVDIKRGLNFAKMRGPTGRELDEEFERAVFKDLKLPGVSRAHHIQCTSRIDYFQLLSGLFAVVLTVEKAATDLRLLAIEEVGEVNEGYSAERVGSSSMPHKSNPVNMEKISGLTRLLRGYLISASENTALWLERDISHSSVERVMLPDFFHLTCHVLTTFNMILTNLQVNQGNISRNFRSAATAMGSFHRLHINETLSNGRVPARKSL